LLRVFDSDGKSIREASLDPPDSSALLAAGGMTANASANQVRRIIGMADGAFLVEWLHAESVGGAGQRRTTFLALHDQAGRPLTAAAHPPSRPAVPIHCDSQGRVLFLHLNRISQNFAVELMTTTLILE
jgi:hypothetical protein